MKKKKEQSLKTWLIPKLRRLSFMWPPAAEAMRLARVERGKYKCAKCNNIFGPKDVQRDHINPVMNTKNIIDEDFDKYIGNIVTSMFPKVEGYQILCIKCHDEKTLAEDILRDNNKKVKK